MNYSVLGEILKNARVKAKYTQPEIAAKFGVTFQNVSSWERGRSKIDIDTYIKLCQLYSIDLVYPLSVASDIQIDSPMSYTELTDDEREFIDNLRMLNYFGQKKVSTYMADLIDTKKYTGNERSNIYRVAKQPKHEGTSLNNDMLKRMTNLKDSDSIASDEDL